MLKARGDVCMFRGCRHLWSLLYWCQMSFLQTQPLFQTMTLKSEVKVTIETFFCFIIYCVCVIRVCARDGHVPDSLPGARLWRRKKRTSALCCPHRWSTSSILSPSPTARSEDGWNTLKNVNANVWSINAPINSILKRSNYAKLDKVKMCQYQCRSNVHAKFALWILSNHVCVISSICI